MSAAAVQSMSGGGDPAKFPGAGCKTLPGASYRSEWWVLHNGFGAYSARGIHCQAICVEPTAEIVIARSAKFPIAENAAVDPATISPHEAVADFLLSEDE